MILRTIFVSVLGLAWACSSTAQEYRVEVVETAPPADSLSAELAGVLANKAVRVLEADGDAVCEIWLARSWALRPDFSPSIDILYPFEPGQLIGVLRLPERGSDFRDQRINPGVFTLRYAQQPVDGNHVGTSPTRDFLLMVRTSQDASTATMNMEELQTASAAAARSSHPAMMMLARRQLPEGTSLPTLRHDEANQRWILGMTGKSAGDEPQRDVVLELVVVGHANE